MEDNIKEMYEKGAGAFKIVEYWPQEKVDEMVLAVGWELQKPETADELARHGRREVGDRGLRGQGSQDRDEGSRHALRPDWDQDVRPCGRGQGEGHPEVRQADRRDCERGSVYEPRVDGLLYCAQHVEDAQCDHLLAAPAYGAGDLYDGGAHPEGADESRRRWIWFSASATRQRKDPGADGELRLRRGHGRRGTGQGRLRRGRSRPDRGRGNVVSIVDSTVKDIPGSPSGSENPRRPTMRPPVPRRTRLRSRSASSTR